MTTTLPDGQVYFVEYADVTLERQLRGKPWRPVATTVSSGSDGVFTFYNVKRVPNTAYRVRFDGKTYTTDVGEVTVAPSTSTAKGIRVMRDFELSSANWHGRMIFKGASSRRTRARWSRPRVRTCNRCS